MIYEDHLGAGRRPIFFAFGTINYRFLLQNRWKVVAKSQKISAFGGKTVELFAHTKIRLRRKTVDKKPQNFLEICPKPQNFYEICPKTAELFSQNLPQKPQNFLKTPKNRRTISAVLRLTAELFYPGPDVSPGKKIYKKIYQIGKKITSLIFLS